MNAKTRTMLRTLARQATGVLCISLIMPGDTLLYAATPQAKPAAQPAQQTSSPAQTIPPDQLDSLVAPIALYPDPLLAQTLAASTYPLEIIQLQQWLQKNSGLKDKALADAVAKQPWDPSVQALAPMPDLVKRLADDLQWTTDLGNAFLAQQSDVMAAVQRMRKKAQDKGNLKSSEQQKVETTVVEGKQTIVIQPASTEVVYVPSYNPTVVYGAPPYPYPPIYYPPPGYYAAGMAISFGIGVMMGAFWGGGWGWGCGWGGGNSVYINNSNNFINNSNRVNGGNRVNNSLPGRAGGVGGVGGAGGVGGVGGAGGVGGVGGAGGVGGVGGAGGVGGVGGAGKPGGVGGAGKPGGVGGAGGVGGVGGAGGRGGWQHNPAHRGGAPYADRATANKFGGAARGDSLSSRQGAARQQVSRQGGNMPSTRGGGGVGSAGRGGLGSNGGGGLGGDRGGAGGVGGANRGGAGGGGVGGGGDRVGNRSTSSGGGNRSSAFGGGSSGFNGASARANSSRGSSSFGGGGGGGGRGGGGGGGRGGGGRRR